MRRSLAAIPLLFTSVIFAQTPDMRAQQIAAYAVETYEVAMVDSLRELVKHNTVAVEGLPALDNPAHQAFKAELARQAHRLGLDFQDHGYVVVIALGEAEKRLGVITHGDIQPVDPSKWTRSPFELDETSEPGRLIGRGTEDDKGPISTALYAMKAIKDKGIALNRRIELYVYMAEESDWGPLQEFVKANSLPDLNITIDAEYPVVTAEKGYGTLSMTFADQLIDTAQPYLSEFSGGFFGSQIPEDATVVIQHADNALVAQLKSQAKQYNNMQFQFDQHGNVLRIQAKGKSAHSSKPDDGVNAISYLAALLNGQRWPNNAAGSLVNFINDQLGTGLYGDKFGDIAYADDFMGPMTVSPTVIKGVDDGVQLNINIRRPRGKTAEQLDVEINQALDAWQIASGVTLAARHNYIGEPFVQTGAPHIDTLLAVFSHYTGIQNPEPIAIGGGTNSRLFPNAVSFGPSMPGVEYTGHSEHEFISRAQFRLNLQMYTAVMVELAGKTP
ncbi:dipeptidase [Bowmanella denitrificans]|uniref:Dipeptidase n=1 Tax=Bowmanella denitrificans TaxID=366582 RepID=A0ABP3GHG0_9ALTE